MKSNDPMELLLRKLRYSVTAERRERTLQNVFHTIDDVHEQIRATCGPHLWRITVSTPAGRLALAAAVILIVLSGFTFWPSSNGSRDQWWLGPPAAWGREILTALEPVKAVSFRERSMDVAADGSRSTASTWMICYVSEDSFRRDIYDGNTLREIQWYVPDGNDMIQYGIRYDLGCYGAERHKGSLAIEDPVQRICFRLKLQDKADRLLGERVIDGHLCAGFEIHANKYGSNPDTWIDCVWFDVQTRLPVRMEQTGQFITGATTVTTTKVTDQFNFDAQLPAETFLLPAPPQGFVNAHPDDIQAARDRQVKGEAADAQVPDGVKEKVLAALENIASGSYRKNDVRTTSFWKNAWREDATGAEHLTLWCVRRGALPARPFEPNDNFVLTETLVDFDRRTFQVREHTGRSQPEHPMTSILFVARLIDRADRFYERVERDGVLCFGFEVSAKKYGDNPEGMVQRMWLDAATNLPVRIEWEWPRDDGLGMFKEIKDRFQWNLSWPEDHFVPRIPAGFTEIETAQK